jgi:hypothetical protein
VLFRVGQPKKVKMAETKEGVNKIKLDSKNPIVRQLELARDTIVVAG